MPYSTAFPTPYPTNNSNKGTLKIKNENPENYSEINSPDANSFSGSIYRKRSYIQSESPQNY